MEKYFTSEEIKYEIYSYLVLFYCFQKLLVLEA